MYPKQIRISFYLIVLAFVSFLLLIILTSRKAYQPAFLRSVGFKTRLLLPQRFGYFIIRGNDYYHKSLFIVEKGRLKKVDTRYHSSFNSYGFSHYSKVAHTAANGTMYTYPATIINNEKQIDSFVQHAPFVLNRYFSCMKFFRDKHVVMLCSRPSAVIDQGYHYPIKAYKFYVPGNTN